MSETHDRRDQSRSLSRLGWTLALVLLYMVAEIIGGLVTGSLALLADAGHMLSDAGSLALALFAIWIGRRPRSPRRSFGYRRTEILAALANGITLVVVAILITIEAWERLLSPREVDGRTMLWIAIGGLAINLTGLWLLHEDRDSSLNVKGAWLHVLADTLGSLQAIGAGVLIWAFGWNVADPIASMLIALLVVWSSWPLLRDSVHILMEGTPKHLDAEEVQAAVERVEGVVEVHDLHLWTITSGFESASVHVRFANRDRSALLREIRHLIRERFGIAHSTVQLEETDECPSRAFEEGCSS